MSNQQTRDIRHRPFTLKDLADTIIIGGLIGLLMAALGLGT